MIEFFRTLFGLKSNSGDTAKERLRLVLLSDHLSLEPDLVDSLKRDLLEVIARYVEIDSNHADITFEHRDREIAMLASVPVTGVRRAEPAPARLTVVPESVVPETVEPAAVEPVLIEAPEPAAEAQAEPRAEAETEAVRGADDAADAEGLAGTAAPARVPQQSSQAARPRRRRRRRAAAPAPIPKPPSEGTNEAIQA